MITFVLGTIMGGIIGMFIMSLMVVSKRADQWSEQKNIDIQHP